MLISLCLPSFLDTVPLLVSPKSDPEEELELGELCMELPRMKGKKMLLKAKIFLKYNLYVGDTRSPSG